MDADQLTDGDIDALADSVIERLDPGRYGDRFIFSRRQVMAIAGGGLSVGALTALGVDEATAQEAVGQVGTEDDRVDVKGVDGDFSGSVSVDGEASAGSVSTEDINNIPAPSEITTIELNNETLGEDVPVSSSARRVLLDISIEDDDDSAGELRANMAGTTDFYSYLTISGSGISSESSQSYWLLGEYEGGKGLSGDVFIEYPASRVQVAGLLTCDSSDTSTFLDTIYKGYSNATTQSLDDGVTLTSTTNISGEIIVKEVF